MIDLLDTQIYSLIGEEGFEKLVAAFYRQVPGDPVLGPMYPAKDFAGAQLRLREFLIQRFGGPDRYSRQRGHPALRRRHARFTINEEAKGRWLQLMERALQETDLAPAAVGPLRKFFHEAAAFLINTPG